MSTLSCTAFRAEAARRVQGRVAPPSVAFSAHWSTCPACRRELGGEEALERLLALPPSPDAPRDLADRVLARLGPVRPVAANAGAANTGAASADPRSATAAEERALDRVLDLARPVAIPPELSGSLLARLAPERDGSRRRARRVLAGAAALFLAGSAWLWQRSTERSPSIEVHEPAAGVTDATELVEDEELLAYALERWELLTDEDLDLWLASLDPTDEALMEFAGGSAWLGEQGGAPEAREEDRD